MRIAEINMFLNGSTGNIMMNIAKCARKEGVEVDTYSTNTFSYRYQKLPKPPLGHCYYGTYLENTIHYFMGRTIGFNGCFSVLATKRLVKKMKKDKVDIIHLHNIHGYCINLFVLFRFIKKNNIKLVWTLHDCWSFTGHCPYFDIANCEKWKDGCQKCPQINRYPSSIFDDSKYMYKLKKKLLGDLKNVVLVTPSEWLANQIKDSFLKNNTVNVINNGIDLNIFKPTSSTYRNKWMCEEKKIILGVANCWEYKKGLDVFIELASILDDEYQIVLVGTDEKVDEILPANVISIHRTKNQEELSKIYTAADLFINPTREDNFPTVNIEALACGTPVLTFNTGGSPEIINKTCGSIVKKDDVEALYDELIRIFSDVPYSEEACRKRAKYFDAENNYKKYVELFKSLIEER